MTNRRSGNAAPKLCSLEGCDRRSVSRGMCDFHYCRWKRGADLHAPARRPKNNGRPCEIEGCDDPMWARGFCQRHYPRLQKYGDARANVREPRRKGTGHINRDGYKKVTVAGRFVLEHRYVMEQVLGRPLEPHETVHHLNGIRDDNRAENLELWVVPPTRGQRPEDLARWVVANYPHLVAEALNDASSQSVQARLT